MLYVDGEYNVLEQAAASLFVYKVKLARAFQMPGMCAQTFHAGYGKFDRMNFEANCDFHYSICMKRLPSHPRYLTRSSQLVSCKRDLNLISVSRMNTSHLITMTSSEHVWPTYL
jgi:hypothetical protein